MKTMDELFKYRKTALVNGLCGEYKGFWQAAGNDKEKLVKLALSQQALPHFITYCNNGDGLSKGYILENFAEYINGKATIQNADGVDGYTYQLYVAENGILSPSADVSAYMWCNDTTLETKATKCPVFYIGCGSHVRLVLGGYNAIKVYLFDESTIDIEEADDTCSATIYKYSDECMVNKGIYCLSERIKEHKKQLRL